MKERKETKEEEKEGFNREDTSSWTTCPLARARNAT
jgi:hypothetical protein